MINDNVTDPGVTASRNTNPGYTNSGKRQRETNTLLFESRVVIAAEIVFAAVLLYLTNHPLELNDLTTAQFTATPATQATAYSTTESGNNFISRNSVIETSVRGTDFTTLPAEIAVAATNVEASALENGINN